MRKHIAWILGLTLLLAAACACAETEGRAFESVEELEWTFSSGAGGWSTDLVILADGTFSGEYHDSEMGESGEDYPYGTVYGCSFAGKMTIPEQADAQPLKIRVESLTTDEQPAERIEDGIRYVFAEPYGISEGDEMLLYLPGTPLGEIPEEMRFWAHAADPEDADAALETWFLTSDANGSGFVGYPAGEEAYVANPWEEMTAEELPEASGLTFAVPEGAEDVVYRFLRSMGMAEMQFTLYGDEFCARLMPAGLQGEELEDISGMYYDWELEEAETVHHCRGTIAQAGTDDGKTVERCLWYDAVPGLLGSLSVVSDDVDGLDLAALAEQVYVPVQGND